MSEDKILPKIEGLKRPRSNSQRSACSSELHEPVRFSGRYKITEDLGQGGIGRVYKAYDLWSEKEIALKILTAENKVPLLFEDFKKEFILLTRLRHPGVVEVLDFGYAKSSKRVKPTNDSVHMDSFWGEAPFFTMEFVEGKTPSQSFDLLNCKDSMVGEFEKLYHFIWQICDILEYLHLRGIVHCDLKPDNLKVTDRVFNLKLLDFGLSEKIGTKRKKTTKGTLPYMAPEMFSDESFDQRTDLYSLGIILYELVTSQLPFFSDDPMKIASGHLEQAPVPPKDLNPLLPEALNRLLLRLLEKSPSQRPQSASEVKEFAVKHIKNNSELSERNTSLAHLYSGEPVARDEEQAQMAKLLKQMVSSEGKIVLLAGEQGVGKSFFLKDLKIKCQLEGMLYVDSNCLENQTKAYQPLIEILHNLKPYLQNCDPSLKEEFDRVWGSILQKPRDKAFALPPEQSFAHQKILESLICLSRVFPLVLVIDNLQCIDFQTLRFLSDLGQNLEKTKILLAGAFRSEEIKEGSSLGELIDRWREKGCCRRIKLDRFDYPKTIMFIRSKLKREDFPEAFFSYMHRNTSGNPFFLTEVLKYLLENQIIFQKDSVWKVDPEKLEQTSVPDSMEAVLLKNLDRYDQKTLDFLNAVAVIGKKFDSEMVKKSNLVAESNLSKILFTLTEDQIFLKKESPLRGRPYYEFANQSLQNLLYQRFGKEKKIKLHGKIARLLEKRDLEEDEETIFEIAHHYFEAGEPDKAYQYALLSAEKMEQRFANPEVLRYLEDAIEVASKFPDRQKASENQVAALMKKADFCKRIGELNQAEKDYQTILELLPGSSDLKMLAETYNDLGETYRLKHDYKKGILCLKKTMRIHQKLDDPLELAHTLSYMGLLYRIDSQYQNALNSFQKALEIDQRLGNKSYIASTLNNMGLVYWSQHQYSQARKYFSQALSVYRDLDNKEWIARCLNNIGSTFFESGEYLKCVDYYLESLKLNDQIKNKKEKTFNLENLSEVYRKIGDYPGALEYGEKGLQLASEIDFTERVGRILKDIGVTYFELGEYQKAYGHFQKAIKIAEKIEDKELQVLVLTATSKFFAILNDEKSSTRLLEEASGIITAINDERSLISVYQIRSWLKRREGQFQEAWKLLEGALTLAKKLNLGEEIFSLMIEHAELYWDSKEIEKSREFLNRARNFGLERYVLHQPAYYLISGKVEWLGGNMNSAQKDFETALGLAERLNNPDMMWRIHHQLGKLFLLSHNIEKAYQHLKNAGEVLKGLSEGIEDEELKQNYLKDPEKKEMLLDLKATAKDLIGETKMV
jgi:serine/threonine protein kinase/tetratricopeptide (TPR) repeat protein